MIGERYESKLNGPLIVLAKYKATYWTVKFIETGYITIARDGHIRSGQVADKLRPSAQGVGFLGDWEYSTKEYKCAYLKWYDMLSRCYGKNVKHNYSDCSVCEEWHNFKNFALWYKENYVEGYQLDKDIKVEGNRVYSPDTCLFVSAAKNTEAAMAKTYHFLSPLGVPTEIYNLHKFCRENGLNSSHMCGVYQGKRSTHKGWTV